jgi:hypothetical protein
MLALVLVCLNTGRGAGLKQDAYRSSSLSMTRIADGKMEMILF